MNGMDRAIFVLDLCGVAVYAISGALAAGRKRLDVFGVLVLACVTAMGGGTLRDLLLDSGPVFWVTQPLYLIVALLAGAATFVLVRFPGLPAGMLTIADAFGLALVTVIGTEKALACGTALPIAVVMGVMTGICGGMLRDVLTGEVPLVLRREIYATASLCGALVLVTILPLSGMRFPAVAASAATTVSLRLWAVRRKLSLPPWFPGDGHPGSAP